MKTGDRLNRDMELHFIEIPKYRNDGKKAKDMTRMEKWLNYFANKMTEQEKEELAMSDAAISNAMKAARQFLASTEERRQYLNREMTIMDYNSLMESSRQQGLEQGLKKGLEQGLEKGIEQGLEKGLEQGLEKGESRMIKLIHSLMQDGKNDLIAEVIANQTLRNEYYNKYGI